jgi:hypothetical protein
MELEITRKVPNEISIIKREFLLKALEFLKSREKESKLIKRSLSELIGLQI